MRATGERPVRDHTPASLVALHEAGYVVVDRHIGEGVGVDIGCGLGTESAALARPGRQVIGIDYDQQTASAAAARLDAAMCADARVLPIASGALDWVCSSHIIEHFTDPERHVAEIARVLRPGGTAVFLTPNAPADFENPFHVHLFLPEQLRRLLESHFDEVVLCGLDGNERVSAEFARRRRTGRRILALDVFGLRHRLPDRALAAVHSVGRRVVYPLLTRGGTETTTADDFRLLDPTDEITDDVLVLAAIVRST
ncbi:MAG: class I SAM-dependent methyltransferase [Ilumatobacteraceae bacterium]